MRSTLTAVTLFISCSTLAFPWRALAQPPARSAALNLVEMVKLDRKLKLDVRYATSNNFMHKKLYPEARVFLLRPAAEALVRVHQHLRQLGYGLLLFDGYRPWRITKKMWDETPVNKHQFVADPTQGSRHNRGCAVDLTLIDLKTDEPVAMPSDYDEFSARAYANFPGGTAEARRTRDLLRQEMEREGFKVYSYEWWHFDFQGWEQFPVMDVDFEDLDRLKLPKS